MAADLTKVRQIGVYVPHDFYRKVQREAVAQHRSVGAQAFVILKEYFDKKEKDEWQKNETSLK